MLSDVLAVCSELLRCCCRTVLIDPVCHHASIVELVLCQVNLLLFVKLGCRKVESEGFLKACQGIRIESLVLGWKIVVAKLVQESSYGSLDLHCIVASILSFQSAGENHG